MNLSYLDTYFISSFIYFNCLLKSCAGGTNKKYKGKILKLSMSKIISWKKTYDKDPIMYKQYINANGRIKNIFNYNMSNIIKAYEEFSWIK